MHFMIVEWTGPELLHWEIVFYCHDLELYRKIKDKYPEPRYVHMIDMKAIKYVQFIQELEEARKK